MNKEFVPYDIALKLKELGFNEDCFGFYEKSLMGKQERFSLRLDWTPQDYPFDNDLHCLAPIWQQVFDYFRNNYYLHVEIRSYTAKKFTFVIQKLENVVNYIEYGGIHNSFNNYEEARLACLEKLIKILVDSKK